MSWRVFNCLGFSAPGSFNHLFYHCLLTSIGLLLLVFRALPSMYHEVIQYFKNG